MIHYFEGQLGHFFVVTAFVSSLVSFLAFFKARNQDERWTAFGAKLFYIHSGAVLGIIGVLFYMITNHYFEYHYVFSHSSKLLPTHYQISCFWEGQEGSFLLWIFWNAVLGIVLIHTGKCWKGPVMSVLSFAQLLLVSMILGVVVFGVKIGSSPFMLLRDVINAPIFHTNPDFIPEDGNGLNPLLQNYWMVIHPPVLFLGFAASIVPFTYCVGGLMIGKNREWVRPALPWALFAALILGVGILMGAYWAYETLSFGGYWSWDPVENAIYVPWLVLVASIHVMITHKKSGTALKLSTALTIASFILVLYATFLTRSGILGDSSVHSFTDLGLSGQLLICLAIFLGMSVFLAARRWKYMSGAKKETSFYTRGFWIFMGAAVLCFMAFHVAVNMSISVYNAIAEGFGTTLNMAPATDTYKAYSVPQLIMAIFLATLSGTGQFFWWTKTDKRQLKSRLALPFMITLAVSAFIIVAAGIAEPFYLVLTTAAIYSVIANASIMWSLARTNFKLTGGSIAHTGAALMLIGILFSSGYSRILSVNYTTTVWSREFPDEVNQNNLLLFVNEPRRMDKYRIVYKGIRQYTKERGMVDKNELMPTSFPLKAVRKNRSGYDTLTLVNPENNYFEIEYAVQSGKKITLYPRVQINESMDMTVYSPDIYRTVQADMYTHVRLFPDPSAEASWSKPQEIKVPIGEKFFVNDYVATLEKLEPVKEIAGSPINPGDAAVKAIVKVQGEYGDYIAEPAFIIRDQQFVGRIDEHVNDLAFRISIQTIIPQENVVVFQIQTTQKDWVVLEAIEKPWINLLWLGSFLMVTGFAIAIYRRYGGPEKVHEKAKSRNLTEQLT